MVASEFECRHRFWMMALVNMAAYSFYNLNHRKIHGSRRGSIWFRHTTEQWTALIVRMYKYAAKGILFHFLP
jgi:hypothetical protein